MKYFTLFLLVALVGHATAGPVTFKQEPIAKQPATVTLSDGRVVPFGSGVVCSEECVQADVPGDARGNRRWVVPALIGAGGLAALLIFLPRSPPGVRAPDGPMAPGDPKPNTNIPEPSTIILLAIGLGALKRKLWNNVQSQCI